MLAMFVTFDVSKPERSRLVRLFQLENMLFMFVNFDVSKPEMSRLVRLEHL